MRLFAAMLAGALAAGLTAPLNAHPDPRAHLHVGGGVSHRPWAFTLQTWYRDIVYDEKAEDTRFTSLDIYTRLPPTESAPVMIFVHGGGFRVGDKASSKDLDPKPEYFTSKLGYVFVSVNYRLLPEGQYPRNAQDVANAVAWVHDHIDEYGGDPDRLFLMGHSAGAMLVAQVGTDEQFLKKAGKDLGVLKGVIPNEGSYGVDAGEEDAARMAELLGERWQRETPVSHAGKSKRTPPFLLLHVTGNDTLLEGSDAQAAGFEEALRQAGVRVERVPLDHVEHFGANERLGEPGDIVTVSVERFLNSITGESYPAQWTSPQR